MSDKECPVPEPFSGAIGSVLFLTLLFPLAWPIAALLIIHILTVYYY